MRAVALLIVVLVLLDSASAVSARPAVSTRTTPLAPTVPWPLGTGPAVAHPAATPVATTPVATTRLTSSATPSGDLPYTGLDLVPEAIGAVLFIAAGVALRRRPRWR